MERYLIVIPGKPVAWSRTGGRGKTRFKRPDQRAFVEVAIAAAQRAGVPFLGDRTLKVVIWVFFPPKNPPRKKVPRPMTWYPLGKDWDNLAKMIGDALQGVIWANDSRIAVGGCLKVQAAQGDPPRTVVEITPIDDLEPAGIVPERIRRAGLNTKGTSNDR